MPKGSESYGRGDSPRDSKDPMDSALDFGQNIEKRSRRCEESKWQNEADMVLSLKENPTLCMKAVCAQLKQHTQIISSSHCRNRTLRAFKKFAALSGSELAEFLLDGDPKGDLKKSQKDLEMFKPEGLGDCQRLARYYSKRLFSIYISKKDPFFSPS
ncbi:hypothetical protein C5167_028372 [Papaver somniferum]|nr:hypothetical protein C5167_028372 [Papaver somniferum]